MIENIGFSQRQNSLPKLRNNPNYNELKIYRSTITAYHRFKGLKYTHYNYRLSHNSVMV